MRDDLRVGLTTNSGRQGPCSAGQAAGRIQGRFSAATEILNHAGRQLSCSAGQAVGVLVQVRVPKQLQGNLRVGHGLLDRLPVYCCAPYAAGQLRIMTAAAHHYTGRYHLLHTASAPCQSMLCSTFSAHGTASQEDG